MKNINVGDKVKVIRSADSQWERGTILTVMQNDHSDIPFDCKDEDGTTEWMYPHEVELYSSTTNQLEDRVTALESELAKLKASLAPKAPVIGAHNIFDTVARGHLEGQAQPGKRAPQTANELRKAAIKLAQESVAESFFVNVHGNDVIKTTQHGDLQAFFTVNKENRAVNVVLKYAYTGTDSIVRKGQALCDPTDVFNVDIGKAIALDRALVRETAVEILRAPNPDEVVVGMVVKQNYDTNWGNGKVVRLEEPCSARGYYVEKGSYNMLRTAVILEDTDARYWRRGNAK